MTATVTTGDFSGDHDNERIRNLIHRINDKSLPLDDRDAAKNELLMMQVNFIFARVFRLTGGKVGINDRPTELFDSAFAYLKQRASNIAKSVEDQELSLEVVVSQRLIGWASDKIRRSDLQTLTTGKGRKMEPVAVLEDAAAATLSPDEEVIREEGLAQIKSAVFSAVADLTSIEHAVIASYFGLNGKSELSMREVADELGITLADAHNARRRAQYKLKEWLKEYASNQADEIST